MKQTGLLLDIARKSYQVDDIKKIIDLVHFFNGHYVQLHFQDNEKYSIEQEVLGNPKQSTVLQFDDIKELQDYQRAKNIQLIPELEFPAHCTKMLDLLHHKNWDLWNNVYTRNGYNLNLGASASYQLIEALIYEIFQCFTNTDTIHLGGDEFEFNSDNTEINYANFYNNISLWVLENFNKKVKIWNDGVTKTSLPLLNTRIQIVYWQLTGEVTNQDVINYRLKTRATLEEILSHGCLCWNANSKHLACVPKQDEASSHDGNYAAYIALQEWDLSVYGQNNLIYRVQDSSNVIGSMFCLWGEHLGNRNVGWLITTRKYHIQMVFDLTNQYNQEGITYNQLQSRVYNSYIDVINLSENQVIKDYYVMNHQRLKFYNQDDKERIIHLRAWVGDGSESLTLENFQEESRDDEYNWYKQQNVYLKVDPNVNVILEGEGMAVLNVRKDINKIPDVVEPDTIYYVRTGPGFDLYVQDHTGAIAHKINDNQQDLGNPLEQYRRGRDE